MKSLILGLALLFSSNVFAEVEKSFSGCILAFSVDSSEVENDFKRLVIMSPWTGSDVQQKKGQATFMYKGIEWNISVEYAYVKKQMPSQVFPWYESVVRVEVNGLSGQTNVITHHGDRDYSEMHFLPVDDSLITETTGPQRRVREVPFNVFTFCTPKFEEKVRKDTIYL